VTEHSAYDAEQTKTQELSDKKVGQCTSLYTAPPSKVLLSQVLYAAQSKKIRFLILKHGSSRKDHPCSHP